MQRASRYMERYSILLIVRESEIKTTMRYDLTSARMTIVKKKSTSSKS